MYVYTFSSYETAATYVCMWCYSWSGYGETDLKEVYSVSLNGKFFPEWENSTYVRNMELFKNDRLHKAQEHAHEP